nr:PREDICTED: UDP-glucose 4-epimerase isoform X2 [Bemisia tabaci]
MTPVSLRYLNYVLLCIVVLYSVLPDFMVIEMPQASKVVLVTGGAGYVGSHAVLSLLEHGYQVVVVDNFINACKAKNSPKPVSLLRVEELAGKGTTFYNVDLLNREALTEVFRKHQIECVIHFAALKAVGESCQIPLTYYQNNVSGSIILLEVMKAHNVRRFIYSSSSTVYGTPEFLPFTEAHPTGRNCTNPYGKSKYFVEEIMKDLAASDPSWSIVSLRYFNPVGAHESGQIGEDPVGIPNNLMPYIAQVATGRIASLQVFGNDYDTIDGTGVRDYIHIVDLAVGHVSALEKLLSNDALGFKVYNLGTGTGYSVLQVVKAFEEASNKTIPYKIVPRRPGDIASSYCDASLAKKELGWEAKFGLKKMCEDMWKWQSQNPKGYES